MKELQMESLGKWLEVIELQEDSNLVSLNQHKAYAPATVMFYPWKNNQAWQVFP